MAPTNRGEDRGPVGSDEIDVAAATAARKADRGTPTADELGLRRWVNAGIDAGDIAVWWAAECWDPTVARALLDAGLRPHQLLQADGTPKAIDALSGQSIARAVTESYITPERAVGLVAGRCSLQWVQA